MLLIAALSFAAFSCQPPQASKRYSVTIRVVPDTLPPRTSVYLAGNLPELGSWDAGSVKLERTPDGHWVHHFAADSGVRIEFKFTRGSWRSEAVAPDGLEMPNHIVEVQCDTTITFLVKQWRDLARPRTVLSLDRMRNKGGRIELFEQWRFKSGDDTAYAQPGYDDSSWGLVSSDLRPDDGLPAGWTGIGWFRLPLSVDSSLWNVPCAFMVAQAGASDFYLNGRLLFSIGVVSPIREKEQPHEDTKPRIIALAREPNQVLTVRYSNTRARDFLALGYNAGFETAVVDPDASIGNRIDRSRELTAFQTVFTSVAVMLTILHLLLFVFNPAEKASLVLALFTGCLALLNYLDFQFFFSTSRMESISLLRATAIPLAFAAVLGLLSAYMSARVRPPRHFYVFAVAAAVLALWGIIDPRQTGRQANAIFVAVGSLAWIGVAVRDIFTKGRVNLPSDGTRWILITGALLFVAGTLYQLLSNYGLVPLLPYPPYYIGFTLLAISLSAQLAYVTARNTRELGVQLRQVQELSAKTLAQERRMREEEISRRLLEADNARKTQELEEARRLQFSMLPGKVPQVPGLEIAAHMVPATEVGGDYYDFALGHDGSLTIAIGDATGHGMKAGIMVAAMKSLFNASGAPDDMPAFFNRCTDVLRQMHLGNLFMALALIKIKNRSVTISSAGMPPALLFRATKRTLETLTLKGMPLAAHPGFPYEQRETEFSAGDTLLLMSDGIVELFNERKEMLDIAAVQEHFKDVATEPVDAIITSLNALAKRWRGGFAQADDITFVVVRRSNHAG